MSTNPGMYPPLNQPKKTSPVVWILAILGVFMMLVILAGVGLTFFVSHKIKEAGLDSDTLKRNPAAAAIKVMAALNPNIEIVRMDEDKGLATVRDRKSGKTFEVNFEDAKRGNFTMQAQGQSPLTITTRGEGTGGSVEVKSADGTMNAGSHAVKLPAWIPEYEHADEQGGFSTSSGGGESGTAAFKTKDSASKVLRFYEDSFRSQGMEVQRPTENVLTARRDQKTATVIAGPEDGGSSVNLTFASRK